MANFKATLVLVFLTMYSSYVVLAHNILAEIGVCYGLNGNNLPCPTQVVDLYRNQGFTKMRIYEPYPEVLDALRGSGIRLVLGVRNQDIPQLASGQEAAESCVGNEVVPGEFSESVLPAMQNLQNVLTNNNLDLADITTDYALLVSHQPLVHDGNLGYTNLLDAILDAFFWAMEKESVSDVDIVISESGWPHGGNGNITTAPFASIYNSNFIKRMNAGGTPKKPNALVQGYIFSIIDENMKDPGVEQNWGLFNPSMQPNYDYNLN
ncbi:putative glucan endo-1,3-beta-glucosidase BG4 [Silene latifolia]|uniref:putative glucan endo-1,3-beta-glucosidase BG4 n=1 Tax=Silene latifolia TaxID=37657 RepID=UPI003D76DAD8